MWVGTVCLPAGSQHHPQRPLWGGRRERWLAGGGLAQPFWAGARGLGVGRGVCVCGEVAWHLGVSACPRGTSKGLSEPPVMGCRGGPRSFGGCLGDTLPIGVGWLHSCPCPARPPGLESGVGGSTHHCPGCPQPCTVVPWGALGPPRLFCCIPLLVFRGCVCACVTLLSVPGDGCVGGGPVLLCIVLLLFFLSPAWGVCRPQLAPSQRRGWGGQ